MGVLYLTVFHTVMGHKRRCPACGKQQLVSRLDKDRRYHCKKCGHRFSKQELKAGSSTRP